MQNNKSKITIILADDHTLLREALRNILEKEADFDIVAEAIDGEEAVQLASQFKPEIIIMDISMPKLNGLEATQRIKEKYPDIAVLVLTVHDDNEHILRLLEAGAAGYLTKHVYGREVIQAVRGVITGDVVISPKVMQRIMKHAFQHITKAVPLGAGEKISKRELEILRLAAIGLNNKDIANRLEIGLRTVKSHLAEIFSKLNVSSRTEAVITALRAGILSLSDLE